MSNVSIITPCYNQDRYIGQTIASVRAQTLTDWEQIVVDDGSQDGSASVVQALMRQESRLKLFRQPNGGVANARNNGFKASLEDSNYLLFLDADDCLEPEMLAVMVAYLDAHSEVGLAYCDVRLIGEDDSLLNVEPEEAGWMPRHVPAGLGVRTLPAHCPETPFVSVFGLTTIIPSISLIRRSIFKMTPGFDETFGHIFEDTDLFLQVALRSKIHHVARSLVRYRRHGMQSTADMSKYGRQERKLYTKWREIQGLTAEQQALVNGAFHFREGRLLPYRGVKSGNEHLLKGEVGQAARFYAGAARRYFGSFLRR